MELEGHGEETVKVMEPRNRSLAGPFTCREKQKLPRTSEAGGKAEKHMEGQEDLRVSFLTREKVEALASIQMSKGPAKFQKQLR